MAEKATHILLREAAVQEVTLWRDICHTKRETWRVAFRLCTILRHAQFAAETIFVR